MVAVAVALAFSTAGALIGVLVPRRRSFDDELARHYDASHEMLGTVDLSGCFTRVSPVWARTLGHSSESMCARALVEFVHHDERADVRAKIDATANGSSSSVASCSRFRTIDGKYRWLEWSASTWSSDGLIRVIARDVTEQRSARQQLANSIKWLETTITERTHELDHARAETLQLLAGTVEYRDARMLQHAQRVGALAAEIAMQLGLRAEQVIRLRQAAGLHDIGKLAIPDQILSKPGNLSAEEQRVMQTHAALGARLLSRSSSPVLQMAAVAAATHHEWWNGSGYPSGLAGERIPLIGRIVAVADAFDALTHERPYMPAWPTRHALAGIQRASGSQFDPRVATAVLAIHGQAQPASTDAGERGGDGRDAEEREPSTSASREPSTSASREWRRASAPRVRPGVRGALR